MAAPNEGRRRVALVALVALFALPLVGACASLIGLEDAETDPTGAGTDATGTQGAGAGSSTTASTASGEGGASSASASTSVESSSSSGGGPPVPEWLDVIPELDGVRLAVRDEQSGAVLLVGMRRGGDKKGCIPEPPEGDRRQAVIAEYWPQAHCELYRFLEGDGLLATSLAVVHPGLDPRIEVAGIFGGPVSVDGGQPFTVADDSAGGAFAFDLSGAGSLPPLTRIDAVDPPEDGFKTPVPMPPVALPGPQGIPSFAGTFTDCASVTCTVASTSGKGPGRSGYLVGPGPAAGSCETAAADNALVVDGAPSSDGAASTSAVLYVDASSTLQLATVQQIVEMDADGQPPVADGFDLPVPPLRPFSLRWVSVDEGGYFLVGGTARMFACTGDSERTPFPFVAVYTPDGFLLNCSAGWRIDGPYDRAVVGVGDGSSAVFALHETGPDDGYALARISLRGSAPPDVLPSFCTHCTVDDMAMSNGVVWIMGHGKTGATVFGEPVEDGATFLYHVSFDEALKAPEDN